MSSESNANKPEADVPTLNVADEVVEGVEEVAIEGVEEVAIGGVDERVEGVEEVADEVAEGVEEVAIERVEEVADEVAEGVEEVAVTGNGANAQLFPKPVRHRISIREARAGIKTTDIRRLARRGGVKRMGVDVASVAKAALVDFVTTIIRDTVAYTEHAHRKTVMVNDIIYSLKHNGITLYSGKA